MVLGVLLLGIFLKIRIGAEPKDVPTPVESTHPNPARETADAMVAPSPGAADSTERSARTLSRLAVTVLDANGAPIQGAHCRWSTLPSEDLSGLFVWGLIDWDHATVEIEETTTNDRGQAEFLGDPAHGSLSLVWVWADDYQAGWRVVERADSQFAPLSFSLSKQAGIRVTVLDSNGTSVNGAIVK